MAKCFYCWSPIVYTMRRLLFIGLLIALVGGVQAEELINYSEEIGPYTVSFSLPELPGGPVEFEKNISQTETLSGIINDKYKLSMHSGGEEFCYIIVSHLDKEKEYSLKTLRETQEEYFNNAGFSVLSAEREIDNVTGVIVDAEDVDTGSQLFEFYYFKDKRTGIQGGTMLPWDQTVPLLRTLNVTSSSAP